jgi:hypothetical protein
VDGVGDLVSSVTVGLLWTLATPTWGFVAPLRSGAAQELKPV